MKPSLKLLSTVAFATILSIAGTTALAQNKFVLKIAHADSVDVTTSRKAFMAEAFEREVKAKSGG